MQTVCASCESPQGPFDRKLVGVPICKNTKRDDKRIAECIKRRSILDEQRWGGPRITREMFTITDELGE